MSVLTPLVKTSEVSTVIPAPNEWAFDWDVATIIIVDCDRRGSKDRLIDVLSDSQWIGADRIVDERAKFMDMCSDPLA